MLPTTTIPALDEGAGTWARYEVTLCAKGQVPYEWCPEANCFGWSDNLLDELGYQPDEMRTLEQWLDIIHPEDVAAFQAEVARFKRVGDRFEFEYRVRHRDGHYVFVYDRGEFIDNRSSSSIVIGFLFDITDRKKAEADAERSTAILDATTDFVGTADRDLRARYINAGGRRLCGLSEDRAVAGCHISEFMPDWAGRLVQEVGIPAAESHGTWQGETALLDATAAASSRSVRCLRAGLCQWDD